MSGKLAKLFTCFAFSLLQLLISGSLECPPVHAQNISAEPRLAVLAAGDSNIFRYTPKNYAIQFELPKNTKTTYTALEGDEVFFSVYLANSDLKFKGYIQLWNAPDLKKFLTQSMAASPLDFQAYSINDVNKGGYAGHVIHWQADLDREKTEGLDSWFNINSNGDVLRIFILTDAKNSAAGRTITDLILRTLKINSTNPI